MPRLGQKGNWPNNDPNRQRVVERQIWLTDQHEIEAAEELFPDKTISYGGIRYYGSIQLGLISRDDGLAILQRINDRGNQLRTQEQRRLNPGNGKPRAS